MSCAYARSVEPSERQPGVRPGVKRRTPVRVPGEHETAEVPQVGPVTQDYQLPDIVPAGPRTEVTPIVPRVDDGIATSDLPATEPMVCAEQRVTIDERRTLPVSIRRPGSRHRVRRGTRVVRHIDQWSAFKVGAVFSLAAHVVGLTAGVLLWWVADSTDTFGNIERWFNQFGWETLELKGDEVFVPSRTSGLTALIVSLATLFNLVSNVVGGSNVNLLEDGHPSANRKSLDH